MISGPDRRRRYGAIASRACARAGCRAPATATLRFQSTQRVAWLTAIDDSDEPGQGDVCTRHADALVLPRGWTLRDRRPTASFTLAAVPDPEPEAPRDELAQVLDASTPLLRRAFANVWPLDSESG